MNKKKRNSFSPGKLGRICFCLMCDCMYNVPGSTKISSIGINILPSQYCQVVTSCGLSTSSKEIIEGGRIFCPIASWEPIIHIPCSLLYQIAFDPESWSGSQCNLVLMSLGPTTYNPGIPLMDIAFFAPLFSVTVNASIPVIRKITMVNENKKLIQTYRTFQPGLPTMSDFCPLPTYLKSNVII